MAAAESHRLQQELSCCPRALGLLPSEAVITLGAVPAPLLPLAWGSPSLSTPHPPHSPRSFASQSRNTRENTARALLWHPGHRSPLWGLHRGWCPPQQGPEPPLLCCTQPTQHREQGLFLASGGRLGLPLPPALGTEHLPHGLRHQDPAPDPQHLQGPSMFQTQLPRGKALMAARGTPPAPCLFLCPQCGFGDKLSPPACSRGAPAISPGPSCAAHTPPGAMRSGWGLALLPRCLGQALP